MRRNRKGRTRGEKSCRRSRQWSDRQPSRRKRLEEQDQTEEQESQCCGVRINGRVRYSIFMAFQSCQQCWRYTKRTRNISNVLRPSKVNRLYSISAHSSSHLGPYAITRELLPILNKTALGSLSNDIRVVVVSDAWFIMPANDIWLLLKDTDQWPATAQKQ